MFQKLRNRFLILNMSITSLVMIVAFFVIYMITYDSIQSENQRKLDAMSGTSTRVVAMEDATNSTSQRQSKKGSLESGLSVQMLSPGYFLSFSIEVDTEGNILNINSFIDMPEETYQKAAEMVWNNKKNNSTISLEGKLWLYSISTMDSYMIVNKDGKQSFINTNDGKQLISFLDITDTQKTLRDLLLTFLFVGCAMLGVIFLISLYFANSSIKPISQAWEKQRQFVTDASHELKTPLSIINANYDALLANKEETIKSQTNWFDYMKIGTDRMAKLIDDLLSLAKMEDVNIRINKMPFDISSAVEKILLSMEAVISEKGLILSLSIQPNIIINSDEEIIKQVFLIIYDNAIKYSVDNGTIDVSLWKQRRRIIFKIKNSGIGISKQDLPRIFDRFYRSDQSRTSENGGYGLGLSIAKSCVDKLGGQIRVMSLEDEYTEFEVTLYI